MNAPPQVPIFLLPPHLSPGGFYPLTLALAPYKTFRPPKRAGPAPFNYRANRPTGNSPRVGPFRVFRVGRKFPRPPTKISKFFSSLPRAAAEGPPALGWNLRLPGEARNRRPHSPPPPAPAPISPRPKWALAGCLFPKCQNPSLHQGLGDPEPSRSLSLNLKPSIGRPGFGCLHDIHAGAPRNDPTAVFFNDRP